MLVNEDSPDRPKLLALVGPTAVGKTAYAIEIAKAWNGEIISGDSMQVYRSMNIGTAKADEEQLQTVPHHLIDIVNPDESFSVTEFLRLATGAIMNIDQRGKLPLLVGGTGLYVQAVCYGYDFAEGGGDEMFRQRMNEYADLHGEEALHRMLAGVDPIAAARLHPNDRRRVIRAMEIAERTGKTMTEHLQSQSRVSPYDLCLIGLSMDRAHLYVRIEQRIDEMLKVGLVDEVRGLLESGLDEHCTSMQGLGYKEIVAYLHGRITYDEAVEKLKRDTRRFAKRQLSWFRKMPGLQWVDVTDTENKHEHLLTINDIIAGKFNANTEYTWKQC